MPRIYTSVGGVQVATAFLTELLKTEHWYAFSGQYPWLADCAIYASPEVKANLADKLDPQELDRLRPREGSRLPACHTRFTIFGPTYAPSRAARHIMGFADVTSIYEWPRQLPPRSLRQRIRRPLALSSFRRADALVVETQAVKSRLVELGFTDSRIEVVPNSCHPLFLEQDKWQGRLPASDQPYRLLYVARAYPHKNHDFLGKLALELETFHGVRVRFTVTLNGDEWNARTATFRSYADNAGVTNLSSLPQLYLSSDAAIFPSLLECFSATPLEAMALGVPLLASDRDFVRTACHDAATYFDPDDHVSAAKVVAQSLRDAEGRSARAAAGLVHMRQTPTSMERTRAYLKKIHALMEA